MEKPQIFCSVVVLLVLAPNLATAQLKQNYYANICPNVESIVRSTVSQKLQSSFAAAAGTLRMFFHDCFVRVFCKKIKHYLCIVCLCI
jgi:peroxidase